MKNVFFGFILFVSSLTSAQNGPIIGVSAHTYNYDLLQTWADSYAQVYNHNPLKIPHFGPGLVGGLEVYSGNWNFGWNFVWNRMITKTTQTDLYGNNYTERLKIKFNHFEMPFFYFPFEGPVGLGLTMDIGKQKIRFLDENKQGSAPLNQIQIASKIGFKFRTATDGPHLGGMIYYHWLSVFESVLTDWKTDYDYQIKSVGLRLYWVFGD